MRLPKPVMQAAPHPCFEDGQSVALIFPGHSFFLGQLRSTIALSCGIKEPVFFTEIELNWLMGHLSASIQVKELSNLPTVSRDLSLILPDGLMFTAIEQQIHQLAMVDLKKLYLVDCYQGTLPDGETMRSYTIRLIWKPRTHTFNENEIAQKMNLVRDALIQLGIIIRD